MIHHNKNTISHPLSPRQTQNKVHRNISPSNTSNWERQIKTMLFLALYPNGTSHLSSSIH
ncbi:hypothetical protein U9M48_019008 [Paspalum notatum var. saurae]|uniref:Uncharacterized protein n=1 Tax=Paspalum notatum var. saurae TaxID=547442 RepID=A0AAQ3WQD3_PASNO